MSTLNNIRSGGNILVDQLIEFGVDHAFCVPGESYLDLLDALHDKKDEIRLINARHEAGAANMAEAYGKLTGNPGIALVTRGPGACHASIGVHIAYQDSTPMILFIGQVSRDSADREAFQEIDYRQMFGSVAKWVVQIEKADRIPEIVSRAFNTAISGRPGPVVVSLPEDMLTEKTSAITLKYCPREESEVSEITSNKIKEALSESTKPLIILGGGSWNDDSVSSVTSFAERNNLPIATTFRRLDCVKFRSENYVGNFGTSGPPSMIKNIREVDTLLVIGARLGEMTTQNYKMLEPPKIEQTLIHVHVSPEELGKVYSPDLAITNSSSEFAKSLETINIEDPEKPKSWLLKLREEYIEDINPDPYRGELDLGELFVELRDFVDGNYIFTLDAGNHSGWPMRLLDFGRPNRVLGSTCGSMGYAIPAAVAAAIARPDHTTIAFVGDGGFMMSGLEISTAVQFKAKLIIIIFNNENYGTIRMHQEIDYPNRIIGTDLVNPDFLALASSLGAFSQQVNKNPDFLDAFKKALDHDGVSVIELNVEKKQLSSRLHLDDLK
tara:strand:- start:2590 stop:4251 length:1662 start_codon:yes stop_codon:yes gene_type:complete